jgi:hypothetical protein
MPTKYVESTITEILESCRPFAWFAFENQVNARLNRLQTEPSLQFQFRMEKEEDGIIGIYDATVQMTQLGEGALVSIIRRLLVKKEPIKIPEVRVEYEYYNSHQGESVA